MLTQPRLAPTPWGCSPGALRPRGQDGWGQVDQSPGTGAQRKAKGTDVERVSGHSLSGSLPVEASGLVRLAPLTSWHAATMQRGRGARETEGAQL